MGHGSAQKAPDEGMDHSKMDQWFQCRGASGSMDHSQMGPRPRAKEKAQAMDHSKMGPCANAGQMEGMESFKMNHGSAEARNPPSPYADSRS